MSSITCSTCKISYLNDEISKHLSSTRHKQTKYDPLDEIIECETCDNDNIHQLQILRFGLSDMALLCQTCLGKEEKPSIQYSLSNGSFFKKIDQYYKFRDIECCLCQNDSHLLAGNDKNGKQFIVCYKCLPILQEEQPSVKFVSERDDTFLTTLLGITENTKLKGKFKGRKTKIKRGGKRKKTLSPQMEKEAQERRDHYFNKIKETKELKSGTIVKAVGSEPVKPAQSAKDGFKNAGKSSKGKPTTKGYPKSAYKGNSSPSSNPSSAKSSKANSAKQSRASTPSFSSNGEAGKKGNVTAKGQSRRTPEPSNGNGSKGSSQNRDNGKKSREAPAKGKGKLEKGQKGDKHNTGENAAPNGTSSKQSNGKKTEQNGKRPEQNGKLGTPKKTDSKGKNAESQKKKDQSQSTVKPEKVDKLPNGVVEYIPSDKPKLSYESMTEYKREMSYNLFLEDKMSMSSNQGSFIKSDDFSLAWYEDNDKKHKQYHIQIPLTQNFKDRFLSKKIQKFKKTPFSVDQTMFLVCNENVPWYGKIVLCEANKPKNRKADEILEVIVEQYPWNFQPLPLNINIKHLSLLPASIPISRVFLAMTRVDNPKFISMLLGKSTIRQIEFNNYVKFSDASKFNDSQKVALQSVLNNSITALQGPPGTGKTSTIHEIILQLLNNFNTHPILVVAASNIAIDNIAEKLLPTHEKSLLRIVAAEKELDYNKNHILNSICLHQKVDNLLPQSMKDTLAQLRTFRASEVSVNQYKKVKTKQIDLQNILISQARVIFTTSVVAGGNQLKAIKKFPVVIMDESTQSSEPITLIPLSMPGVDKFVFVGDQKQLSSFTQVPNLSLSLFERVLLNGTYKKAHMLDTQYRMHPAISEFSRNKFYNGLLKDGITEQQRHTDRISKPVLFWDTKGKFEEERVRIRTREDNGYTYTNSGEISFIIQTLQDLIYDKKVKKADIGIITPYRGQRDLISSELSKNELINPEKEEVKIEVDRDDIYNETKPVTIHTVSDIMIASIDAFQGREKDFIIFSCVRSNKANKIGFLNDERRLNVAITRARYGMILIGDYQCLQHDDLWKEYLDHLSTKGFVTDKLEF